MLELTDATGTTAAGSQAACRASWPRSASTGSRAATWLPHVTVLRYRDPPRLQPELPELGPIVRPRLLLFYPVCTRPGRVYEVLESFPLKAREVEG